MILLYSLNMTAYYITQESSTDPNRWKTNIEKHCEFNENKAFARGTLVDLNLFTTLGFFYFGILIDRFLLKGTKNSWNGIG